MWTANSIRQMSDEEIWDQEDDLMEWSRRTLMRDEISDKNAELLDAICERLGYSSWASLEDHALWHHEALIRERYEASLEDDE
jgi:hypothetical protein